MTSGEPYLAPYIARASRATGLHVRLSDDLPLPPCVFGRCDGSRQYIDNLGKPAIGGVDRTVECPCALRSVDVVRLISLQILFGASQRGEVCKRSFDGWRTINLCNAAKGEIFTRRPVR